MANRKIKAIFFDVADVLAVESFTLGIRQYEYLHNLQPGKLYEAIHDHSYWKDFSLGKISEKEYFKSVKDNFSGNLDINELKGLIQGGLSPNKELLSFLKTLAKNYILGIISNNPKEWFDDFYTTNKLENIFKVLAISSYLGIRKPDKRLFEIALKMAGIASEEAIYVDDRPEMTIEAAELGINIIVYRGLENFKEELKRFKII